MITTEQLKQIIPTNKESDLWFEHIQAILPAYGIDTPKRLAGFLAQASHESSEFRVLEENLNYSAEGLAKTWPTRFTVASAKPYARKPEKIANSVYANRMGNGNEASGDGWKFRGRGIKQLTGKNNYIQFGKSVGMTAEEAANYCSTKKGAVESAAWFWKTNNLNKHADADDITAMTKAINGGLIGLDDRKKRYEMVKKILGDAPVAEVKVATPKPATVNKPAVVAKTTVRRGDRGDTVSKIQTALGLFADGIFGIATELALKEWQGKNSMVADGIATPTVLNKLLA